MRAVIVNQLSKSCEIGTVAKPLLSKSHSILVKVHYTAVNRADLLQKQGKYPPPVGASDILGLECSGEVVDILCPEGSAGEVEQNGGQGKTQSKKFAIGDRVMALLEGGGYAEYAACAPGSLMRVPESWTLQQAACVPEVWLTAYQLLRRVANMQPGENVLLHAGASAVSLAAAQLGSEVFHANSVVALTRSREKIPLCESMGTRAVSGRLRDEFFAEMPRAELFDVVLDPIVGENFWPCLSEMTRRDARYVVYASMGGPKVPDFNFGPVFRKSLSILTSTLRARSLEYKAALVADFEKDVLHPFLSPGRLKLNLDTVFPLERVTEAHARLENNDTGGKIVLAL
ncbi:unnamed protein product [Amoebophrya sp. A25]|nr:unnamed protein product [Amoebophrya sp. A25]|eukprot:GSA25T00003584001.1